LTFIFYCINLRTYYLIKTKKFTIVTNLWYNLFRAIEIAKTGDYSISVHFGEGYKSGFDDYKAIKKFCKGWFENFVSDGDIKVELVKPASYNVNSNPETFEIISNRIEKYLEFNKPDLNLCKSSESLLKTATQRLELSFNQIQKIKQIAATIAQMDFSNTIQVTHISEAIQYSFVYCDICYNAEYEYKTFGDNIKVKMCEIDIDTIKSAISYLNGLLP